MRRAAIALFCASLSSTAFADEPPAHVVEAERLFEAGKELLGRDDWTAACKLFDASVGLDEVAPAIVKVARCRSREGRHALAIAAYGRALDRQPWPELEQLIRSERREEEARTATIVVRVVGPPDGFVLLRNGATISVDELKAPLFTDPNTTERFTAMAPRHQAATHELTAERAGQTLELLIRLEPERAATAPTPPAKPLAPRVVRTVDPARATAYAFGGAGALALGFSAGFGVQFLVLRDEVFDDCQGQLADGTHVCPESTNDRVDDAVTARTNAQVLLVVGGALVAGCLTAAIVAWTADAKESDKSTVRSVRVDAGWQGLSVGGAF